MILVLFLAAQLHVATPAHDLVHRTKFAADVPVAPADFQAAGAKVFNVTARQFDFSFSPDLVVNQGDSVTLIIRSEDVTHGFALEEYMVQGVIVEPGKTASVSFVAHSPGTFTFFCNFFCGDGHGGMFGRMTVNATSQSAPSISGLTPSSGPIAGGTVVVISGANFQNDAVVKFGSVNAVSTIFQSASRLTAFAPAHPAGQVVVTVTNPDGQSASSPAPFTFVDPNPKPVRRRAVRR
jgi:plastocyanin